MPQQQMRMMPKWIGSTPYAVIMGSRTGVTSMMMARVSINMPRNSKRITTKNVSYTHLFVGRIFEPFSRAEDSRISKIQGTGLGMAISQNIIHMMNGEITVDSTLGKGSRFTVSVALKFRDAEDGEPPVLTDLPVLVVDDERDVCEYASLLLKEVGMLSLIHI